MVTVANESCILKCLGLIIVWQKKKKLGDSLIIGTVRKLYCVSSSHFCSFSDLFVEDLAGGGMKRLTGKGMAFKKQERGRGPMCVGHGSCWINVVHSKKRWRNAAMASSAM